MSKLLAKGKSSKGNFDFTKVSKKKYQHLESKNLESKTTTKNNKTAPSDSHADVSSKNQFLNARKSSIDTNNVATPSFWELLAANHQPQSQPVKPQSQKESIHSEPVKNQQKVAEKNNSETKAVTQEALPLKSFENDMKPGERNLLLTSMILSKQDEIDQHLAKRSWQEEADDSKDADKIELSLSHKTKLSDNLDLDLEQPSLSKSQAEAGEYNKHKDWEFMSKSRQKVQQEFDLDKRNWGRNPKIGLEDERVDSKEQEVLEKQQKIMQAQQNYQRQQQKSQNNFILKVISIGCLLAALLFYFQGWQPLVLSQITTKNQEKIQTLSHSYQIKVGDYFNLIQNLSDQMQSNTNQCQLKEYQNIQTDAKNIEDLINQKLQSEPLQEPEKYWIFRLPQIDQEYEQAFSRYQQSLSIYRNKSDYLVDYLYFLQQRNTWLAACQKIQETNSLVEFNEICQDFATKNKEYQQKRQSKFWSSLEPILQSFEPLCQDLETTESPSQWRLEFLTQYNFLVKYRPDNDNDKLYQMNEQTLGEFQTRSRNIYTIYEQKTDNWGYLYFLKFEF